MDNLRWENVIYFDFFIWKNIFPKIHHPHNYDYTEQTRGNGSPTVGHSQYLRHNYDHDFDHGDNNANYWLCPNKTETNGKVPTHQAYPYDESLKWTQWRILRLLERPFDLS